MARADAGEGEGGMKTLGVGLLAVAAALAVVPCSAEETRSLPGFGEVTVYRPADLHDARGVVLFVSGDGGWNLGVVDMARRLAPRAIVAGISLPDWARRAAGHADRCWYPAGELEVAAQSLEKQLGLPRYVPPILVGYSSGATLVYGAMAQAPSTTFAGAISLGFCPDLEVARPLCGSADWKPRYDAGKRVSWLPEGRLPGANATSSRWVALQGTIDQVCAPDRTAAFVSRTGGGRVVMLEKVGHGFSVPARWGRAFDEAAASFLEPDGLLVARPPVHAAEAPAAIAAALDRLDLPLEVTWPEGARAALIFLSGDGGWADLDRSIAEGLTRRGVAVIAWNSLHYFWSARSPAVLAGDLRRVVAALPPDVRLFAGGYSFGAETVPVAVASGGGGLERLRGLVLVAPGPYATFEISPLDWVRSGESPTDHPVTPVLDSLRAPPALCLQGSDDAESGCPKGGNSVVRSETLPGGHHFGGDWDRLVDRIASFVLPGAPVPTSPP
jgi:type IV secretory pathway VirJ component